MNEKATRMYEILQGIFKNESETELKLLALKLTEVKHDKRDRPKSRRGRRKMTRVDEIIGYATEAKTAIEAIIDCAYNENPTELAALIEEANDALRDLRFLDIFFNDSEVEK